MAFRILLKTNLQNMKINRILAAAFVAAASVLGLASCGSGQKSENGAEVATEAIGQKAPDHAVIVLEKGAAIAPEENKLVVIDFNATWCGPCRQFAPIFDKVAENFASKAVFYSVDVDVHPELVAQYGVQNIPMVAYIKPDGSYTTTVGLIPEQDVTAAVEASLK